MRRPTLIIHLIKLFKMKTIPLANTLHLFYFSSQTNVWLKFPALLMDIILHDVATCVVQEKISDYGLSVFFPMRDLIQTSVSPFGVTLAEKLFYLTFRVHQYIIKE